MAVALVSVSLKRTASAELLHGVAVVSLKRVAVVVAARRERGCCGIIETCGVAARRARLCCVA